MTTQDSDITLPPPPALPWSADTVEIYAKECLIAVGLTDWRFGWDRAIRRLGCCRYQRKLITLSQHFVAHFLQENPQQIIRTLLHEIAHALAYVHHKETGHGSIWKHYCTLLGIAGETARCRCSDFAPQDRPSPTYRYVLCHKVTGEIFRRYQRPPRRTPQQLAATYIIGRKKETLGQLCVRRSEAND